jgi:hypothetical protein
MKSSTFFWIIGLCILVIAAAFLFCYGAYSFMSPTAFQPGDKVTHIYNETVIVDGHVCQKTTAGIVAYSSTQNFGKWYGPQVDMTKFPFVFSAVNIVNEDEENTQEMVKVGDLDLFKTGINYCSKSTLDTPVP